MLSVLQSEFLRMVVVKPGIFSAALLPLPAPQTNKAQKAAQCGGVDLCMLFMVIQLHCEDLGEAL